MGTFMASVSFRRANHTVWSDLKPKIQEMYHGIDGLVSNLEQEREAYAIVSPYGDMGMFLQDIPEAVSRLTEDYAIFCMCVDSDFAILELYHNGTLVEKSAVGEEELLAEIDELADLSTPNLSLWKPLLQNPEDEQALQTAFTDDAVFVDDQLREISALTGMYVRSDIAMTGEISLRGRVLPIGGLKEKTMAALRHGIHTVIIPKANEKDLQDIDPVVRNALNFITAQSVETVIESALYRDASVTPVILREIPEDIAHRQSKPAIQQ